MPRGTWGSYRTGVLTGAYNTVEVNVGAYNTVCGRVVVLHYSAKYGPWCHGLTCEPRPTFLRTPFGSFRAGVPGRMAPVDTGAPVGEKQWAGFSMNPGRRHGVGVGGGPRVRLSGWRSCQGGRWPDASAPIGEAVRSWPKPELVLWSERWAKGG